MQDLPHSPDQRATVLTSPEGAQTPAPAAAEAAPAAKRRPLLDRLGSFAHDSHEFLNSKTGRLAVRNGMGAAWGIFWLLFPYVGVRMGMNAFANANALNHSANNFEVKPGTGPIREAFAHMCASQSFREIMAVGTSFSTYRITNKAWKFGYDMLAAPHANEEAAQETARKLPGAVGQFIKHYAPAEAASTIPAAFPLVIIQNGLNGPTSQQHTKKGLAYSLGTAWPAYWAFFSVTNTLFKKLTGHTGTLQDVVAKADKGDSPEFVTAQKLVHKTGLDQQPALQQLAQKAETEQKEKPPETVVDKVLGAIKFATSISVGITAYYIGKRHFNLGPMGRQKMTTVSNVDEKSGITLAEPVPKKGDNFLESFKKEGAGLEMFFMFTVLEEATNMLLTKPFKKLANFLNKTVYDKKPGLQDAPVLVAAAPSAGEAAHAMVDNEVPQRQHTQSVAPKSTASILENGPKDRLSRPDPAAQPSYQL